MGNPGPSPKVSNDRLLFEILVMDSPSVFASQVREQVPYDSTQQVRDRMNDLVDDELLKKKEISGRNLYSLSDMGRDRIITAVRPLLD